MTDTRICPKCKVEKPLTPEFWYKSNRYKSGYQTYCKQCCIDQAKIWYQENTEKANERVNQWYFDKSRSEGDEYKQFREKQNEKRRKFREVHKREKQPCVYLIYAENGVYKIGRTNDIESRFETIKNISPIPVELILTINAENNRKLEMELHEKFSEKRYYNEWFRLDKSDVEYIKSLSGYNL